MNTLYFISAELSTLTKEINQGRTAYLKHALKNLGLSAKPCLGRYKSVDEASFVIEATPETASVIQLKLQDIALRFDQECILALRGSNGSLIDHTGTQIASLTLESDSLVEHRPDHDHTAIPIGDRYRVLVLKG